MTRSAFAACMLGGLMVAATAPPAAAEGDPDKGKKVFNQCRACHSLKAGEHRVGPSLAGIWGREAGTAEGFPRYSYAMKEADVVWNAGTLDAYLADVRGYVPGNRMTYPRVRSDGQRADLIAYLEQVMK